MHSIGDEGGAAGEGGASTSDSMQSGSVLVFVPPLLRHLETVVSHAQNLHLPFLSL